MSDVVAAGGKRREAAFDEVLDDRRYTGLAFRIDADDGRADLAAGIADDALRPEARGKAPRNPAIEPGSRGGRVDDAAAVVARPEPGDFHCREHVLRRLAPGGALLVGDIDMRHRVDELLDEIVLSALHQRRHGDGEADAYRDAKHGDNRLTTATSDMCKCDVEDERHHRINPAAARRRLRARRPQDWPGRAK